MKSDVITIDNAGNGFQDAVAETRKVAEYHQLCKKDVLHLELIAEEMLSLMRSVTGEMKASFWLEMEGRHCTLHLATKTVMDKEKRRLLISTASSRKNEAASSFLGFLRNAFEEAITAEAEHSYTEIPMDVLSDISSYSVDDPEWDGYERSVLRKIANHIAIAIRGGTVDMTVSKTFTAS